jgi:hypothetical protein
MKTQVSLVFDTEYIMLFYIYSEVYQSFPISIADILPTWSNVVMNFHVTNSGVEVSHDGYYVGFVNLSKKICRSL